MSQSTFLASTHNPFAVYIQRLNDVELALKSGYIKPHHVLFDTGRILNDILVVAAQVFLEHRTPPMLLALTVDYSLTTVMERLRDANLISPYMSRQIDDLKELQQWALKSSSRNISQERALNCYSVARRLVLSYSLDVYSALIAKQPRNGCAESGHTSCRDMLPLHLDVVGGPHNAHEKDKKRQLSKDGHSSSSSSFEHSTLVNPEAKRPLKPRPRLHHVLPYNWSNEDLQQHCIPLHNTGHLHLDTLEAEEEEKEREERARLREAEEEHARRKAEAAERRKQRIEAAEEARRNRAEADGEQLSDLEEDEDEGNDSEEERLTARRKAARAQAQLDEEDGDEGDEDGAEEDDERSAEEKEAEKQRQAEERAAQEEEDEKLLNEPATVAPLPTRYSFTFCCMVCHSILLRARDIDRVENNQVWSRRLGDNEEEEEVSGEDGGAISRKGLASLVKNFTDVWTSRPADDIPKKRRQDADEDGGEGEEEEYEDEDGQGESGDGGDGGEEDMPPEYEYDEEGNELPLPDLGAKRREQSVGVHCAGCDYYVGRFYERKQQYKLIYIHRSTGQNFMYFTGDASVLRLKPALEWKEENENEEEDGEGEEEDDGPEEDEDEEAYHARKAAERQARLEARLHAPIPPLYGLPQVYVNAQQAAKYPFPRFASLTPYSRASSYEIFKRLLLDEEAQQLAIEHSKPKPKRSEEEEEEEADLDDDDEGRAEERRAAAAAKAAQAAIVPTTSTGFTVLGLIPYILHKNVLKENHRRHRPVLPLLPFIQSMLHAQPDSLYAFAPTATAAASASASSSTLSKKSSTTVALPDFWSDLSVLLWTDRTFHNRLHLYRVSSRIQLFFMQFPSGVYVNTNKPVIPLFTYFYVEKPDFTMARGTARYLFHYLTKKDDSKLKRLQYSYKKFQKALKKFENAVFHMTIGGWGGHRFVLVKIGTCYRIFQSNNCIDAPAQRYTVLQWLQSQYRWSRILSAEELSLFLAKFEEARRGSKKIWEELFCMSYPTRTNYDLAMDQFDPSQVYFAQAKLLDFATKF